MSEDTTVLVATRGRPGLAERLIDCLSPHVGASILVRDDGSEPRGAIRARRDHMLETETRWLLVLDDDARPGPGSIAAAESILASQPLVGAVAFDLGRSLVSAGEVPAYCAAGVLFRMEALEHAGIWPDWEAGPFELDHSIRLRARGWRIYRDPRCWVVHEVHPGARPTEARNIGVIEHLTEMVRAYWPAGERMRLLSRIAWRCCYLSVERGDPRYGQAYLRGLHSEVQRMDVPREVLASTRISTNLLGLAI